MAKMTNAILDGKPISIDEGLRLRDTDGKRKGAKLLFHCDECGQRVRAHKSGGHNPAHFEHFSRNKNCSQSDKRFR